jgi:hypothetical protein
LLIARTFYSKIAPLKTFKGKELREAQSLLLTKGEVVAWVEGWGKVRGITKHKPIHT